MATRSVPHMGGATTGRSKPPISSARDSWLRQGATRVWGARPVGTGAHVKTKPGMEGAISLPRLKYQLAPRQQPTVNFQADELGVLPHGRAPSPGAPLCGTVNLQRGGVPYPHCGVEIASKTPRAPTALAAMVLKGPGTTPGMGCVRNEGVVPPSPPAVKSRGKSLHLWKHSSAGKHCELRLAR